MTRAWRVLMTVIVLGVLIVQYQQYLVLREVARAMTIEISSASLTTSWKSGGQVVTVTTQKEIGESDSALLVRHTAAVQAKLQTHPID